MLGGSPWELFGILHMRRSPSAVCAASISDFCFDEEPCQESALMGEGARVVLSVCKIVNEGCSAAIRIEPLRYLGRGQHVF